MGNSNYLGNFLLYTTPVSAALALTARSWPRLLAIFSTVISVVAIAFSGTRGAWIGLVAWMAAFAFLELKSGAVNSILARNRRAVIVAAMISTAIVVSIIAISPVSRSVTRRAR